MRTTSLPNHQNFLREKIEGKAKGSGDTHRPKVWGNGRLLAWATRGFQVLFWHRLGNSIRHDENALPNFIFHHIYLYIPLAMGISDHKNPQPTERKRKRKCRKSNRLFLKVPLGQKNERRNPKTTIKNTKLYNKRGDLTIELATPDGLRLNPLSDSNWTSLR